MRKSDQFDEDYFKTGFGPTPYERKEPWLSFYANIVDQIVKSIQPNTVMDAGCALGMVVEALWDRGVVAKGVDFSDFAIENVRPDMREHCTVGSIAVPFHERFDLIVCIEVLEHMSADDAKLAILNFASSSDCVLFSSTPHDFDEITHVNVRPTLSWLEQFMDAGFVPDLRYDASYITPHAILFRKGERLPYDVLSLMSEHLRLKHILQNHLQVIENNRVVIDRDIPALRDELKIKSQELVELRSDLSRELLECRELKAKEIAVLRKEQDECVEYYSELSSELNNRIEQLTENLRTVTSSSSWRITAPLRAVGKKMPLRIRRRLRQIAKACYWTVTPHRIPSRIKFIRARNSQIEMGMAQKIDSGLIPSNVMPVSETFNDTSPLLSSRAVIEQHFINLAPLPTFRDRSSEKTITVLTDSVDRNSLFGGVGTALVAGILLAKKTGYRFRLATRNNSPDPSVIGTILQAHKIEFEGSMDFAYIPLDQSKSLSVSDEDIILTTSWWTTFSALGSVRPDSIIYLLQEDERMFYSYDDSRIKCSEILSHPDISVLINTRLLYDHLIKGHDPVANMSRRAVAFEPSFPSFPRPKSLTRSDKRNFFFYARPMHARNLYWRGLEAIDAAMRQGVLHEDEWNIHFVGHHIEPIQLPNGIMPTIWSQMSWMDYAKFIAEMDLGLSLMDTPHPSYPPIDLAASGAVVVTNTHGIKKDLSYLSKNIITVSPDIGSLVEGLREGNIRSINLAERYANCVADHISRDWESSLGPALDDLLSMRSER
ncbi:class I SAM-dependent methyltransferase [Brucella pseudogrignonensis]|uniref:class I SAM-dependent methyltransferase n=1 Tax=Brucella pseudogrignonensis TaxID=419475 RepID=UPI0038B563A0